MEWFGLTDKGRVRPTNQDIYQIEAREANQTALLVVCDEKAVNARMVRLEVAKHGC